jgi:hypothetical protein
VIALMIPRLSSEIGACSFDRRDSCAACCVAHVSTGCLADGFVRATPTNVRRLRMFVDTLDETSWYASIYNPPRRLCEMIDALSFL